MIACLLLSSLLAWLPQEPTVAQTEIVFSGRAELSEKTLRKAAELELKEFLEQGFQRSALDDAAFFIEDAYRAEGFPDAVVKWQLNIIAGKRTADFQISEGRRILLGVLEFPGASVIRPEQLAGLIGATPSGNSKLPFRRSALQALPSAIKEAYWQIGYLDATVEPPEFLNNPDDQRIGARFLIQEGPGYVIRELALEVAGPLGEEVLLQALQPLMDQAYFPRRQVEAQQEIHRRYAEAGYPDSEVKVHVEKNATTGAVKFYVTVAAGETVVLDRIDVEGIERTKPNFIRQRLGIETDSPYDRGKIDEAFLRLFRTGLFRTISIDLGPPAQDPSRRPLIVTVEESPAKEVGFRTRYGAYEGFGLGTSFTHRNIFGTGRSFRARLDGSQVGWGAELGWTDPWFLQSDVSLDVPVFLRRRQQPSFTQEELGVGLDLRYSFTPNLDLASGWSFRRSLISAVTVSTSSEIIAEDIDIAALYLQPEFDTRNDFFNPTDGSLSRFRLEWAGDQILGGDVAFVRTRLNLAHYFPLAEDQSRAIGIGWRAGVAWPLGSTARLPLQERFFNGGEDSVRSFREGELGPLDASRDPLGGESFHTLNVELRQKLQGNLWASTFLDAGSVGLRANDLFDDLRWGTGAGLHYLLPVGALRLDFAWNPDTRAGESELQIFLTVGMAF